MEHLEQFNSKFPGEAWSGVCRSEFTVVQKVLVGLIHYSVTDCHGSRQR